MMPEQVKALRKKTGLTQEQFARVVGVTGRTVSGWETGKTKVSPLALVALRQIEAQQAEKKDDTPCDPS